MRRGILRVRRALVVAPHPDDEAIGAWALLRRLRRAGAHVQVIVASDGAASHPGSGLWPPARLARERRRETRRALREVGIAPARIRFLALPDGGLEAREARLRQRLSRALRRCPQAELIVGPVAGDAHGDHRAVARALAALPRRGERRIGYQVWPEDAKRGAAGLQVPLSGVERGIKRRVLRGYRTQAGAIRDAVAGFAMTHRHLRAFAAPSERFTVLA